MYDVLIVGGGLVGASLAVALQPLGLRLGLIDTQAPQQTASLAHYDDRSVALSYGSSRIYQGMGLWAQLQPQAQAISHIHISDRGYFGATRLSAAQEKVPALGYVVENRLLGTLLYDKLQHSTLAFISPATVYGVDTHNAYQTVHIERAGVADSLQARLLVVADGAQSPLRHLLGIEAQQHDYQQSALIANVSTEKPHQQQAYERFTPDGPLALLPMTAERYALVWTQPPAAAEALLELNDAAFLQALQQAFGYRQGAFTRVGRRAVYPLQLTQATTDIAERAVVMGNAAHTLHPVAGQGLNLALRDVAVLADLIAAAQQHAQDYGAAELLKTYSQSRQPDVRSVVRYTDSLVRIFSNDIAPLGHARAAGLLAVDRIPPLRQALTRQSMGQRFRQARLARGLALRSA